MENNILRKMQSSYKLIIPKFVESKIRTLLKEIYNIEWSGVLFYTYTGSFDTKDLVITCQDILPMNIGSSTYTEFDVNSDVASYMVEHDLLDCQMGLCHSHHNMQTFFSGTDEATLYEEGKDRNNFLSLIVNNAKEYNARITEKETAVITKKVKSSKSFFGLGSKEEESESTITETYVNYYPLTIEFEEELNEDAGLMQRINELKDLKKANEAKKTFNFTKNFEDVWDPKQYVQDNDFMKRAKKISIPQVNNKTTSLEKELPFEGFGSDYDFDKEIEVAVAKLVTGNLLITKLPKDMNKAFPVFDKMWKEACTSLDQESNIAHFLVESVLSDIYDSDAFAMALIDKYTEVVEVYPDFYPTDLIIDTLREYV